MNLLLFALVLLCITHELSFFFINPPRSAATQCMAIKCISEVRS